MWKKVKREGMALALVVVTLGIVGVGAALILAQASLSSLAIHRYAEGDVMVRNILYSCHDEVNAQFRRDISFAPATVSTGIGTCVLSVSEAGDLRNITLTYTDETFSKALIYTLNLDGFTLSSFREE